MVRDFGLQRFDLVTEEHPWRRYSPEGKKFADWEQKGVITYDQLKKTYFKFSPDSQWPNNIWPDNKLAGQKSQAVMRRPEECPHISGRWLLLSGPSGSGKKDLARMMQNYFGVDQVGFEISYVTRAPRKGEVDGKDYWFVSEDEFQERLDNNEFFVHVNNFHARYATSFEGLENSVKNGRVGIMQVSTEFAEAFKLCGYSKQIKFVFVAPTDKQVAHDRLMKRVTGTTEKELEKAVIGVEERCEKLDDEMRHMDVKNWDDDKPFWDLKLYTPDMDSVGGAGRQLASRMEEWFDLKPKGCLDGDCPEGILGVIGNEIPEDEKPNPTLLARVRAKVDEQRREKKMKEASAKAKAKQPPHA